MKVVFFGTSGRSAPILESLKKNFDLVLCVTKNDTLIGRKKTKHETGVKKWAEKNDVQVICINSLKGIELEALIEQIKASKAEYGLVADFGFLIPEILINFFGKKLINIHFSLLPKYRGASPVQYAILNGDTKTGITYLLVSKYLDRGDIIHQIEYNLTCKETSGELYETLFELASYHLPKVLNDFASDKLQPIPQDENKATYTYSKSHPKSTYIFKEDAFSDLTGPVEVIERKIRAFNPWPVCWTKLGLLEKTDVLVVSPIKLKKHVDKNLAIKLFKAAAIGSKLDIVELQVEGKNRVYWKDFANGHVEN